MKASKKRWLWLYRLKAALNRYPQIHCIKLPESNTLTGAVTYDGVTVKFLIKLLPDFAQLKIKFTGVQLMVSYDTCNTEAHYDILFRVIKSGPSQNIPCVFPQMPAPIKNKIKVFPRTCR